ncbi:MAG TPA: cytochrome c [Anaeromyxobacter sp.]|nr:cytochrome c [Anaeromyxobacter sp.]
MKRTLLALAAVAVAAAARADDAAALFQKRCAICHGKDGKGSPGGLKMGAKDLTATTLSVPEMEDVITNGRAKMTPNKGKLTEAEIKSLAQYVKAGLK